MSMTPETTAYKEVIKSLNDTIKKLDDSSQKIISQALNEIRKLPKKTQQYDFMFSLAEYLVGIPNASNEKALKRTLDEYRVALSQYKNDTSAFLTILGDTSSLNLDEKRILDIGDAGRFSGDEALGFQTYESDDIDEREMKEFTSMTFVDDKNYDQVASIKSRLDSERQRENINPKTNSLKKTLTQKENEIVEMLSTLTDRTFDLKTEKHLQGIKRLSNTFLKGLLKVDDMDVVLKGQQKSYTDIFLDEEESLLAESKKEKESQTKQVSLNLIKYILLNSSKLIDLNNAESIKVIHNLLGYLQSLRIQSILKILSLLPDSSKSFYVGSFENIDVDFIVKESLAIEQKKIEQHFKEFNQYVSGRLARSIKLDYKLLGKREGSRIFNELTLFAKFDSRSRKDYGHTFEYGLPASQLPKGTTPKRKSYKKDSGKTSRRAKRASEPADNYVLTMSGNPFAYRIFNWIKERIKNGTWQSNDGKPVPKYSDDKRIKQITFGIIKGLYKTGIHDSRPRHIGGVGGKFFQKTKSIEGLGTEFRLIEYILNIAMLNIKRRFNRAISSREGLAGMYKSKQAYINKRISKLKKLNMEIKKELLQQQQLADIGSKFYAMFEMFIDNVERGSKNKYSLNVPKGKFGTKAFNASKKMLTKTLTSYNEMFTGREWLENIRLINQFKNLRKNTNPDRQYESLNSLALLFENIIKSLKEI